MVIVSLHVRTWLVKLRGAIEIESSLKKVQSSVFGCFLQYSSFCSRSLLTAPLLLLFITLSHWQLMFSITNLFILFLFYFNFWLFFYCNNYYINSIFNSVNYFLLRDKCNNNVSIFYTFLIQSINYIPYLHCSLFF